jgi:hypothetical protein
MPMLYYFFSLPDVWANMLKAQVVCYDNAIIHFEYVLLQNNRYTTLHGTENIPGLARMPPKPYLIHELDFKLVRDRTKPTLHNHPPKLLFKHIKDQPFLILEVTFSYLGNRLELDRFFPAPRTSGYSH